MTRNLRDELSALADEGVGQMSAPDGLAERMGALFAHARRRRPVIVVGATVLVLASAGAAAAGIALLRDEPPAFPDRITQGAAAPQASTGLACGRAPGELQPSVVPMELVAEDPEGVQPTAFAAPLDPEERSWPTVWATSTTTADLAVTMSDTVGTYLVRDGIVVAAPDRAGTTTDTTASPGVGIATPVAPPVMCDGSATPAGTYVAYGSLEVTVHGGDSAGTYDIVGGPWTVVLESTGEASATPDEPPASVLPALDPSATFPQCGAPVVAPRPDPEITWTGGYGLWDIPVDPAGRSTVSLTPSVFGGTVTGYPTTTTALAIVKDGVVVGTSMPGGPVGVAASPPTDLTVGSEAAGTVLYRACSPGTADAGPLPEGRYSLWASQTFHLTERAVSPPGGGPAVPQVVDEDALAFARVTTVAIGPEGGPVVDPGPAAGWPAAIPEDVALAEPADALAVVWVDAAALDDPSYGAIVGEAQEKLASVGYAGAPLPLMCQAAAAEQLGIAAGPNGGTGAAVIFATRAEADAFVELFEHPVRAVVEADVFCHFS